tara:strand:- start:166 stop:909 length:744 start_codon:yes stop_codon:yes gene_type:complete
MLNKIHNPKTNKWVNISGKTGKKVLTNYMKTVNITGGEISLFSKTIKAPPALTAAMPTASVPSPVDTAKKIAQAYKLKADKQKAMAAYAIKEASSGKATPSAAARPGKATSSKKVSPGKATSSKKVSPGIPKPPPPPLTMEEMARLATEKAAAVEKRRSKILAATRSRNESDMAKAYKSSKNTSMETDAAAAWRARVMTEFNCSGRRDKNTVMFTHKKTGDVVNVYNPQFDIYKLEKFLKSYNPDFK